MPTVLRALLFAAVLTVCPVVAGVLLAGGDEEQAAAPPPEPPAYTSTPLSSYDTTTVAVRRQAFCDLLSEDAQAEALDVAPEAERDESSYGNGDRAEVVPKVEDVAHEFGCTVEGGRAVARAWVFAPPVTVARARELVTAAEGERACAPQPDAPAYGAPSVALLCDGRTMRVVSFRGLFGDAWLGCSLAVRSGARISDEGLVDRAGRWCVAVAQAASAV